MQGDIPQREPVHSPEPGNQWIVEQGIAGGELYLLDQTKSRDDKGGAPSHPKKADKPRERKFDDKLAKDELPGWEGYVEWEDYPEKRKAAHEILISQEFPPPPEFQLEQIPGRNPVLEGIRWKDWHRAIGGRLTSVPDESWETVLEEKDSRMLHLLQFPYNGEPPKGLVTECDVTPNSLHFIRNHGGIPTIEPEAWFLRLEGLVKEPKKLTLADLQDESRFPRMERLVTIQCSGTRRIEQIALYAGEGDEMINAPWAEGAIGTARYVGISLKKVIKDCGGLVDGGQHLELVGADTYFKMNEVMNYAISVPWSKVQANEVMLVWEMNGKPLPKIHGAPLRAVVMGYIGARSVKWLYRITAIKEPTRAPVQSREYLYFTQQVGKHNQRWTDGIQIQEMPVSSAIMSPWNKQVVIHEGKIAMKGWAYSGGGRWPERVEVSANGGFSWYMVAVENLSPKHKFAWRTWHTEVPCDVEGWIELVVRCWDNSLNTQPTEVRNAWNWGLHVTSSAHRVKIYSVNKSKERTKARLEEFEKRGIDFVPITRPTEFPFQTWDEYEDFFQRNGPRDVEV
ncbi:sulfite oxidase [Xylaria scruposa]|nr:sulfite oxidase [Xylaria scruposa]